MAMLFPLGVLSGLCVILGLGAGVMFRNVLAPGIMELGMREMASGEVLELSFGSGLWGPLPAMLLIGVGILLGLIFYGAGRAFKVRRVSSFIGGELEPPAPTHLSGTGFYLSVRNLPGLRGLYSDAEGEAFDVYRIGGQYGSKLVEWLRSLHSGLLEAYVAWCIFGVALVTMALVFLLT